MDLLASELASAGGSGAGQAATARLRELLHEALRSGREDLARARSGYERPVAVGVARCEATLVAATPAPAALKADPAAANERTWLLVAATVAALSDLAAAPPARGPGELNVAAGELAGGFLAIALPVRGEPLAPADFDELVPLALAGHVDGIDRLRAQGHALPPAVFEGVPTRLRPPIGVSHPLRVAEALARMGGRPSDPGSVSEREDELLAVLADGARGPVRPHEEPDRARRIARRILQRLDGMGKWGGYHTEFAHLSRGFAGNERALAQRVGEALLDAGLLAEKPSVGQRHVYLDPRRVGDIRALIDSGREPAGLVLPEG